MATLNNSVHNSVQNSGKQNASKNNGHKSGKQVKTTKIKKHFFSVNMSYSECEDLYRHQIKFIVVTDTDGLRIQLPKQNMQKFLNPQGIKGNFQLEIDQNNKIISIKQM